MDPFERLGAERRCYFSAEELKVLYHQRAQALHPDSVHGDTGEFVHLNAAYRKLLDPAERLRLLLAEDYASNSWSENTLPSRTDLFEESAKALHDASEWIGKIKVASSPIARSSLLSDREKILSAMDALLAKIEIWHEELNQHLQDMDADASLKKPEKISALAADFSYSNRWLKKLRDQKFEISAI